ncbi:MAG: bifunctional phosphopantothenoylcysteine decarboxylase/phosphopantothenate--cysteine ligase CoaBC [Alphaproteobacteria bacterium]|nr:MAG: bifunctional phosphopantothenoylcysteine decarboxylase/phosphopantothenate--cysteine ligase CoaBC [Alphaproteobacteria bacterium]
MLKNKKILLIITGGIAAYKSLDLIRRLREAGASVTGVLTRSGAEFITPLAVSALTGTQTYSDLFSLKDEVDMGHIRLSRESDMILVAPATADFMSRMIQGRADDLAAATLLASDKPVVIAPAMNSKMWWNEATQANLNQLRERGIHVLGPEEGDLACGEIGDGRMAEVAEIVSWVKNFLFDRTRLKGLKILITAGPTVEPIDPVRFISNRSSGKQGYAIADACAMAGAEVILISGPTALRVPVNCTRIDVQTADDMLKASQDSLPADIAICTAGVSDWTAKARQTKKMKKQSGQKEMTLELKQTPDILQSIAAHTKRPQLVIGFAAETNDMVKHAREKLLSKNCDWILANDIGANPGILGGEQNQITLLTRDGSEEWPLLDKRQVGQLLVDRIANFMKNKKQLTRKAS